MTESDSTKPASDELDAPTRPVGRSQGITPNSGSSETEGNQAGEALVRMSTWWQGPIPPPELLEAFGEVDPLLPERIMSLAERESSHRQGLERQAQDAEIADRECERDERFRGQMLGFGLALVCITSATLLGLFGQPILAGVIGGTTLVSIVAVFVRHQKHVRLSSGGEQTH